VPLPGILRFAPHAPFLTVQQPGQHLAVMDVGRRDLDGGNQLALAVDAEVALPPEVPLLALLGLMHLRIARARRILRRRGRGDDCRVDDGRGTDRQPPRLQLPGPVVEERPAPSSHRAPATCPKSMPTNARMMGES